MNEVIIYTIGSVLMVSAASFVGVITLGIKEAFLKRILFYLVSFSAGALLGDVFLHILPEMGESGFGLTEGFSFLGGIVVLFVLERFIHWHHNHREHDEGVHAVVYMTTIGDALHNFIDGIVIAASFLVSIPVGVATTVAVIFHEIPQEIGQFATLIHGGWSKKKAIIYNFISALTAVLGAILVLVFARNLEQAPSWLLAISASSFIYVALSDIIPELHEETDYKKSLIQFAWFIVGVLMMGALLLVE